MPIRWNYSIFEENYSFEMNQKLVQIVVVLFIIFLSILYLSMHQSNRMVQFNISKRNYSTAQVRIYCIIVTAPQYFHTRARAVHQTWAPRCDGYTFISESSDDTKGLPIAPIANITPGYDHLTQKSTLAFHYVYEHFLNHYDWFVKADDDTYLFVENLKLFLTDKNSSEPVTYGYNFKVAVPRGYQSGGAAYVLSRESVKRFYQAHHKPNAACVKDGDVEDIEIANCLRSVGVYPGKSIDSNNRERFHALSFADHFFGYFPDWLVQNSENKPVAGNSCCSNTTISFHYCTPELQYLIDHIRYGMNKRR